MCGSAGGASSIAGVQKSTAATSPRAMASAGATAAEARSRAVPDWTSASWSARRASGRPAAPKLETTATRLPTCASAESPSRKKRTIPARTPAHASALTQVTRSRRSGHERSGDVHRRGVLDEDRVCRGRTLRRDDEADDHDRVARRPEPCPRLSQWRDGGTAQARATAGEPSRPGRVARRTPATPRWRGVDRRRS